MYAVIETGGKQYRVEVGTELEVELLHAEAGQSITLDRVLLVADGEQAAVGQPIVANATVAADVVRQVRGEKLISFKYRPKARRRVTKGHRQELTLLRISDIVFDGKSAAEDVRSREEAERSERQRIEEAARKQAAADAELAAKLAEKAAPKPRTPSGRATGKSAAQAEGPAKSASKSGGTTSRPASRTARSAGQKADAGGSTKARGTKSPADDASPAAEATADPSGTADEPTNARKDGEA